MVQNGFFPLCNVLLVFPLILLCASVWRRSAPFVFTSADVSPMGVDHRHEIWCEAKINAISVSAPQGLETRVQARIISGEWVAQRCQAFVIGPDSPQMRIPYLALKSRGSIVTVIDRATPEDSAPDVAALDNYKAGWRAGQMMADALQHSGNVAVLRSVAGVVSSEQRVTGFIDATLQSGLNIVLDTHIGASVSEGRRNAYEALRELSDKVDGVFTSNEPSTLGTCIALNHLGLAQRVIHVGIDVSFVMRKVLSVRGGVRS